MNAPCEMPRESYKCRTRISLRKNEYVHRGKSTRETKALYVNHLDQIPYMVTCKIYLVTYIQYITLHCSTLNLVSFIESKYAWGSRREEFLPHPFRSPSLPLTTFSNTKHQTSHHPRTRWDLHMHPQCAKSYTSCGDVRKHTVPSSVEKRPHDRNKSTNATPIAPSTFKIKFDFFRVVTFSTSRA